MSLDLVTSTSLPQAASSGEPNPLLPDGVELLLASVTGLVVVAAIVLLVVLLVRSRRSRGTTDGGHVG